MKSVGVLDKKRVSDFVATNHTIRIGTVAGVVSADTEIESAATWSKPDRSCNRSYRRSRAGSCRGRAVSRTINIDRVVNWIAAVDVLAIY